MAGIIVKHLDRKTFRKMISKQNKIFKDLVIRIRRNEKDIVYYNGNKAFEVAGNADIEISFPTNVYQCNTTDIEDNYQKGIIDDYKNNLTKICKEIEEYFEFRMDKIFIKKASEYNSKTFFNKINKFTEKYKIKNDLQLLSKELEDSKQHSITFEKKLNNITDIINIQFDFIDIVKLNENKKANKLIYTPIFKFYALPKNNKEIIYNKNNKSLEILMNCFKNAIEKYTGKDELEKKYQHQFMLKEKFSLDIFNDIKGLESFEQEYGINSYLPKEQKGRVDAIFTRIINDSLEDIYLIELKVNESVLLGTNGIIKHLKDINYFINDKKNINNKTQKQLLLENIRYRYIILNDKKSNFQFKNNNPRYHFYTIIGFTNNISRDKANTIIKSLFIKDNNSNELNNINQVKPTNDKCEIKFFYETNNWNTKDISINFIEKYEKELKDE